MKTYRANIHQEATAAYHGRFSTKPSITRRANRADKGRTLTSPRSDETVKNLRKLLSYLLTAKMMERSLRLGWSKVVGSGSNLVANDHLPTFPGEATRQFY
jgi:hypothetical protein